MTKREALRQTDQENILINLGFTASEADALRRISMTLHRWFEHECNGAIQRDGDRGDGKPAWYSTTTGKRICAVPDREAGAMRRLKAIMAARNDRALAAIPLNDLRREQRKGYRGFSPMTFYIQSDPRGTSLYLLRPDDVPEGADVSSYYSRGICVY
jgi:hypothetical protein